MMLVKRGQLSRECAWLEQVIARRRQALATEPALRRDGFVRDLALLALRRDELALQERRLWLSTNAPGGAA